MTTKKDRRSHEGAGDNQEFRSPGAGSLILPIFGENFEGHGVRKKANHTGFTKRKAPFAGESRFGWGVHADGTADCIDTREILYWTQGMDKDDWYVLWDAEATGTELDYGVGRGYELMIKRIVTTVQIQFTGVVFVPDPTEWSVLVSSARGDLTQAFGTLVPRPAYDPNGARVRAEIFRRTAKERKRCL